MARLGALAGWSPAGKDRSGNQRWTNPDGKTVSRSTYERALAASVAGRRIPAGQAPSVVSAARAAARARPGREVRAETVRAEVRRQLAPTVPFKTPPPPPGGIAIPGAVPLGRDSKGAALWELDGRRITRDQYQREARRRIGLTNDAAGKRWRELQSHPVVAQVRQTYRDQGVDVWSVEFQAALRRHMVNPDGSTLPKPDVAGLASDPAVQALVAAAGGDMSAVAGGGGGGGAAGGPGDQSYNVELEDGAEIDWDYDPQDYDPDEFPDDPFDDDSGGFDPWGDE